MENNEQLPKKYIDHILSQKKYDKSFFFENLDRRYENKATAHYEFLLLHSKSKRLRGKDTICRKYNCAFNLKIREYCADGLKYLTNAVVKPQIGKTRSPSRLTELAMVKVAQRLPLYKLNTLAEMYFNFDHLLNINIRGGINGNRYIHELKRVFLINICEKIGISFMKEEDEDYYEQLCINPISYCVKCEAIDFGPDFIRSRQAHCILCSFVGNVRFSTNILERNGHYSECPNHLNRYDTFCKKEN